MKLIYESAASVLCLKIHDGIFVLHKFPFSAGRFSLFQFHWAYAKIPNIVQLEHAIYGFSFCLWVHIEEHAFKHRYISSLR